LSYSDDGNWWGEEACYDALTADYPELADDADFLDKFDAMFDAGSFDDMEAAELELEQYLEEVYDLDIDDYFNWEDWRVEHMDS